MVSETDGGKMGIISEDFLHSNGFRKQVNKQLGSPCSGKEWGEEVVRGEDKGCRCKQRGKELTRM